MKKEEIEVRDFYNLFLQKEILLDTRLSPTDRLLLAFVIAWDNKYGCYASNYKLSVVVGCTEATISKSIRHLMSCGYIVENRDIDGRGYARRVKETLKFHKPAIKIAASSPKKIPRRSR